MRATGRKRGPGRPPKAREEVLTVQFGVHVTAAEAKLIRKAVGTVGARSLSAWARRVLRDAARSVLASEKAREERRQKS